LCEGKNRREGASGRRERVELFFLKKKWGGSSTRRSLPYTRTKIRGGKVRNGTGDGPQFLVCNRRLKKNETKQGKKSGKTKHLLKNLVVNYGV